MRVWVGRGETGECISMTIMMITAILVPRDRERGKREVRTVCNR